MNVCHIALLALALLIGGCSVSAAPVATESAACSMAQHFVKKQLKAPATATFAPCQPPDTVVTRQERLWRVRSYVDAQNGFGAMLRNDYTTTLIYYPATDTWTLVDSALLAR